MGEINNFFFENVIEPIGKYLNLTEVLMIEREKEGVKRGGMSIQLEIHYFILMC